jgi:hypothetical protein
MMSAIVFLCMHVQALLINYAIQEGKTVPGMFIEHYLLNTGVGGELMTVGLHCVWRGEGCGFKT